jgi:hypothetical protein
VLRVGLPVVSDAECCSHTRRMTCKIGRGEAEGETVKRTKREGVDESERAVWCPSNGLFKKPVAPGTGVTLDHRYHHTDRA